MFTNEVFGMCVIYQPQWNSCGFVHFSVYYYPTRGLLSVFLAEVIVNMFSEMHLMNCEPGWHLS